MYTDNKTVQILISLLKKFRIRYAVLSPGTRNLPLVHSLEQDPDFQCHSIVDERSAAYFALGIALEKREPVLISCTSGTAPTNYTSAMWEASKQNLPLLAITSDRNPYYLGQLEDQMVDQVNLYRSAVKKSVSLPIIKDDKDFWYCQRLCNEALLALNHRGGGPVHINLPTEWGLFAQNFNTQTLPDCRLIQRYTLQNQVELPKKVEELRQKNRVLVIYGQSQPVDEQTKKNIEGFAEKYNCVIATETISNLPIKQSINTSLICRALNKELFKEYAPDLVISVNGNYISPLKGLLKGCLVDFDHWTINQEGAVVDQFKRLSSIFECSTSEFFNYFNQAAEDSLSENKYLAFWKDRISCCPIPNFSYSSAYVMQSFLEKIPAGSLLHHGNGVAVHMAQYFPTDPSIITYCHSGTTTIDGSLSTFIGQASITNRLSFIFIGDLSFFYDMNALWNRYVGKNVRILLYNNEGGQTFHWNSARDVETLPLHTSAEHFTSAKGWVESIGFSYLEAKTKSELDSVLPIFVSADSDRPILLEVFTKNELDGQVLHDYYDQYRQILQNLESQ